MELWEITEEKVKTVVERIVKASNPFSVILFGSYIRGQMGVNSDLDVLVVVNDATKNCRQESVRIRQALKGVLIPIDIIVVRQQDLHRFVNIPGLIYTSALKEGKVAYEKAA